MPATAEVTHHWAVTRGNHPDQAPFYCPLLQPRHTAAVTEYHRLLEPVPDDATSLWTQRADMAVVVPAQDATFWYTLQAVVETTWTPVSPTTSQDAVLAAARAELATRPTARVTGDHPAAGPPRPTRAARTTTRSLWLATRPDDDPTTSEGTWAVPVTADGVTTRDQALHLYLDTAADLGDPLPDPQDLVLWHALQATATTPWHPATEPTDPPTLLDTLYDTLLSTR